MQTNQFIKFIGAGTIAACANFFSRILLSCFLNYVSAILTAYLIGMTTAFLLCRKLVFTPQKNNNWQQIVYFSAVNSAAILQTIIVSLLLVNYGFIWIHDLALRETLAHLFGISIPIFTSYAGHKFLTFK